MLGVIMMYLTQVIKLNKYMEAILITVTSAVYIVLKVTICYFVISNEYYAGLAMMKTFKGSKTSLCSPIHCVINITAGKNSANIYLKRRCLCAARMMSNTRMCLKLD